MQQSTLDCRAWKHYLRAIPISAWSRRMPLPVLCCYSCYALALSMSPIGSFRFVVTVLVGIAVRRQMLLIAVAQEQSQSIENSPSIADTKMPLPPKSVRIYEKDCNNAPHTSPCSIGACVSSWTFVPSRRNYCASVDCGFEYSVTGTPTKSLPQDHGLEGHLQIIMYPRIS